MRRTAIIFLLVCACATTKSAAPTPTPSAPATEVLPDFGLVVPTGQDTYALQLQPRAALPPPELVFEVVEIATGRHVKARVTGEPRASDTGLMVPIAWVKESLDASRIGVALLGVASPPRAEQFRQCTSTEGVHVTLWSGAPLASKRLWHAYWHAGYDLDPTCEPQEMEGEVAPPGP